MAHVAEATKRSIKKKNNKCKFDIILKNILTLPTLISNYIYFFLHRK